MQPFLAESMPQRRGALVLASVVTLVALLFLLSHVGHGKRRYHKRTHCHCDHATYIVVVR